MSDFTTLSRTEWLNLAGGFYQQLFPKLERLTPAQWNLATPYLSWRIRDVLAHMTSAMPVNFRQMLDRALAGDPSAPAEFDTFRRNAREVARRRSKPTSELIAEFRSELDSLLAIYRRIPDSLWLRPAWFFVGRVNVRSLFLVQFADNVLHERDLLVAANAWKGLDPAYADPLADWFLRELRPATFRPERARGLRAVGRYRLTGPSGGEWTMTIADGRCRVDRGGSGSPDFMIAAETEDLITAAQARAAPWMGRLARAVQGIRGPARAEDVVASITGIASGLWAVLTRRIVVSGNRVLAGRANRAFWHFWQRTAMTAENIARG